MSVFNGPLILRNIPEKSMRQLSENFKISFTNFLLLLSATW
jgi:hypothetical protein